jgi:hypothetical protein
VTIKEAQTSDLSRSSFNADGWAGSLKSPFWRAG